MTLIWYNNNIFAERSAVRKRSKAAIRKDAEEYSKPEVTSTLNHSNLTSLPAHRRVETTNTHTPAATISRLKTYAAASEAFNMPQSLPRPFPETK